MSCRGTSMNWIGQRPSPQKTRSEKQDALALMSELTGAKAPAHLTKADAQEVKAALFKLPKNRSKSPRTRNLSLAQMLDLKDVPRIAARTMNGYIGHMQHFMGWAVDNGYAAENVFTGMRLRKTAKGTGEGRQAFKADELQVMHQELTNPQSVLVKKDVHRWPALIGMFTGMRLNEVAQLEVQDIEERDGVWCINVTPDGDDQKRLKNASSRRLVPVHDGLLDCGFLGFVEGQREAGSTRLFPSLTYTAQNGYGRNAGRWFNDQFLPKMGLGGQGLTFPLPTAHDDYSVDAGRGRGASGEGHCRAYPDRRDPRDVLQGQLPARATPGHDQQVRLLDT
jgi:integrase